jgi:hypothetical protein
MKQAVFLFITILTLSISGAFAQNAQPDKIVENQNPPTSANSIDNISSEITKISKSLQTLNKRIKDLLDQSALNKGIQLNEKQQKLLLGFEILNRAEQRLEILQKFQIELAEKESSLRIRLTQVEQESRSDSVDRSVAFVGTTKTEEIRESRRRTLEAERISLTNLLSQIRGNFIQTSSELRQAEVLVQSLRKKILPQIEIEISDL